MAHYIAIRRLAANSDFDYIDSNELLIELLDELVLLQLGAPIIRDLLSMFAVFTLLQTLRTIDNIKDIANAVMAVGYSDGDILILGYFLNQQFIEHIEIEIENDEYENSSSTVEILAIKENIPSSIAVLIISQTLSTSSLLT